MCFYGNAKNGQDGQSFSGPILDGLEAILDLRTFNSGEQKAL